MQRLFKVSMLALAVMALAANFFVAPATANSSQMKSTEVISKMKEALSRFTGADMTFNFKIFSQNGDIIAEDVGSFSVQGDAFKMISSNLSIYCDGNVKWIHDVENDEITIFPCDTAAIDFLDNPFAALKNMDAEDFKIPVQSEMAGNSDRQSYRLIIFPKEKKSEFAKIVIYAAADTFLPSAIDCESRNGERYNIDIISFVIAPEREMPFFTPSREILENPDIYITDMR